MMEEKQPLNITFNITGGNNQILPNATKAEQHFHFSGSGEQVAKAATQGKPWTEDDIARLGLYIESRERLTSLVATLTACQSAKEAADALTLLLDHESRLTPDLLVKRNFLEVVMPFLLQVDSGKTVDNLRRCVNNALETRRKNRLRQRM